jgi:hypothetical protein
VAVKIPLPVAPKQILIIQANQRTYKPLYPSAHTYASVVAGLGYFNQWPQPKVVVVKFLSHQTYIAPSCPQHEERKSK